MVSTLKGKNLISRGQILSFYRRPLFRRGLCKESNNEVIKVVKNGGYQPCVPSHLKAIHDAFNTKGIL